MTTTATREPRRFNPRASATDAYEDQTPTYRRLPMSMTSPVVTTSNTGGWISFVYVQFGLALAMAAWSILSLTGIEVQSKIHLAMAVLFSIGATFTLAKTIRDEHEAKKISTRIEDARAEKLLMEVGRG
jgi:hypothetical protein